MSALYSGLPYFISQKKYIVFELLAE